MTHRTVTPFRRALARASLILATLVAPAALDAQILRVPGAAGTRRPIYVSAEFGLARANTRYDAPSGVDWGFGDGSQWRVGLGWANQSGAWVISGSTARMPVAVGATEGDVDLRTFILSYRSPQTMGAHQILELGAGLTQYANLSTDLPTPGEDETRNHFTLDVGYGFGLSVNESFAITLVQGFGMVFGSDGGSASDASRFQQTTATRFGVRIKF